MFKHYRKLWWALLALVVLSPLGLIATGTAFGEWGSEELQSRLGYIPAGFNKLSTFWNHAVLPDYSVPGFTGGFLHAAGGYIISAVVGILLVTILLWALGRLIGQQD